MDANNGRKIEVFAPCEAAIDLTKLILFQPFDLGKWLTIAFAAFLSHLAGGGFNFNYNKGFNSGDWKWKMQSATHDAFGFSSGWPAWVFPLILIAGVFVIALVIVLMWIGSRGKFILVDCVVRNRGAIVEPWNEFKRQGNSYFLFLLITGACALGIAVLVSIPFWLPIAFGHEPEAKPLFVVILIFLALIFIAVAIFLSLVFSFMIPVMYRRRCGALEGFRAALAAITSQPGPVFLLPSIQGRARGGGGIDCLSRYLPDLLYHRDSLCRDGDTFAALRFPHRLHAPFRASVWNRLRCVGKHCGDRTRRAAGCAEHTRATTVTRMNSTSDDTRWRGGERWMRVGLLAAISFGCLILRAIDPTTLSWLPIHTSCGALTGLPCIFCGTTRALHHLLNGNFAQALYFNWIAFPVAALALAIFTKTATELMLQRRFRWNLPTFHFTPKSILVVATAVVLLWTFQVSLALAFHKRELLNPRGLLYALLVR